MVRERRVGTTFFGSFIFKVHVCLLTISASLTQEINGYLDSENESPSTLWFGLGCCHRAEASGCKQACLQAMSLSYLYPHCEKTEEDLLYQCFYKLDEGLQCCQMSSSSECLEACSSLFYNDSVAISVERKRGVYLHCDGANENVISCLQNMTEWKESTPEIPAQNLHCCDKSTSKKCRLACKVILKSAMAGEDIVSSLDNSGCGPPTHHDELWQCFLLSSVANWKTSSSGKTSTSVGSGTGGSLPPYSRNSPPNGELDFLGMDSGKLQCCFRAKTSACLNLCVKTFTNEWTLAWSDFDKLCQYNFVETSMLQCLAEVDEPCRLGCQGLSFCTTFNGRPMEYFRSCNEEADQAARHDLHLWMQEGVLRLPMLDIPVLNVSTCHPETWKVIACLLHVKPCRQRVHINQICNNDCVQLLSRCTDTKRLSDEYTPEKICELLSPPGSDYPCIPISDFISASMTSSVGGSGVSLPCPSGSCSHHELCLINRDCNSSLAVKRLCTTHTCVAGCRMGETSSLVVAQNGYLAIRHSLQGTRCHSLCQCSGKGTLSNCQFVACGASIFCNFNGTKIAHNSHFAIDCNRCYCYGGEITCTRTFCSQDLIKRNNGDRLCHCPNHYVPVCAVNGKTYPSACLAKCMGFQDNQFDYEACYYIDPCEPNPCSLGQKCIRKRRVCLTTKFIFCQQYECVGRTNCSGVALAPVCGSNNVEYPNSCWMMKDNNTLSYHGTCMRGCKKSGSVCGLNGEQYNNECDALADFTAVDYIGGCRAFHSYEEQCHGVLCKELSPNCITIKPFGACCHLCGGGIIQLAYSTKMLEYYLQTLRKMEAASVQSLAAALRRHLAVAECNLVAHLTIDKQISVIVTVESSEPSAALVKACSLEAERLRKLVTLRSPTVVSEMPLATVVGAISVRLQLPSSAGTTPPRLLFLPVVFMLVIVSIPIKMNL